MGESVTTADVYAAECECARLECLSQEADNHARRLRVEYHTAVLHLRELARALGEKTAEAVPEERDLFTEDTG